MSQCYLCKYEKAFCFDYFDNKKRFLCSKCFHEINDIAFSSRSYYIYYSVNVIYVRNKKWEIIFFLNVFAYKELKRPLQYEMNKKEFNVTYLYDFRIGV